MISRFDLLTTDNHDKSNKIENFKADQILG